MQAQDRQEKERADARNALEEYIYDLRGKLGDEELLYNFVQPDHRDKLVASLDSLENWLYDEGEEQNRQVLKLDLIFFICFLLILRKLTVI